MEPTELRRMLKELRAELDSVEAEFAALEARRTWLRQAVTGIEGLLGATEEAPSAVTVDGRVPRGREAALQILKEHPFREMTISDMVEELESRGWAPKSERPEGVIRTTMGRLMKDHPGEVVRVRDGVYQYRPEPGSEVARVREPKEALL